MDARPQSHPAAVFFVRRRVTYHSAEWAEHRVEAAHVRGPVDALVFARRADRAAGAAIGASRHDVRLRCECRAATDAVVNGQDIGHRNTPAGHSSGDGPAFIVAARSHCGQPCASTSSEPAGHNRHMVHINRVYTRAGDDGTTALGGGQRVQKDSLRIEAYGTVDELNSGVGVAVASGLLSPGAFRTATGLPRSSPGP